MNLRLLEQLRHLDAEVATKFPSPFDPGLGRLGLILYPKPKHGGYYGTPINSLAFAGTGGDGVHFSFITDQGKVTDRSPVIMTAPASGPDNYVLGENLFDFLCLGMYQGYFSLEQFAYQPQEALALYSTSRGPVETEDAAEEKDQQSRLAFLTEKLALKPWIDVEKKLADLKQRFLSTLQFAP